MIDVGVIKGKQNTDVGNVEIKKKERIFLVHIEKISNESLLLPFVRKWISLHSTAIILSDDSRELDEMN